MSAILPCQIVSNKMIQSNQHRHLSKLSLPVRTHQYQWLIGLSAIATVSYRYAAGAKQATHPPAADSFAKPISLLPGICSWLLLAILVRTGPLSAEPIPVRYLEGTTHGFLALRTTEGKLLAAGDLTEVHHGNQVKARLVFRFKDGSVDDDTTVFTERGVFRLVSDHHVQKGPSFPHPTDLSIHATTGQVTIRYQDKDKEEVNSEHLDLPPDVANGLILTILKNISPDTKETKVSYVGGAPKPRLVHLSITPNGEEAFSVAGGHHKATRFTEKVEIGGIAGMIAPMVGKKPADTNVWVVHEGAPAFVRADQALYVGGPIWRIEIAGPVWP